MTSGKEIKEEFPGGHAKIIYISQKWENRNFTCG